MDLPPPPALPPGPAPAPSGIRAGEGAAREHRVAVRGVERGRAARQAGTLDVLVSLIGAFLALVLLAGPLTPTVGRSEPSSTALLTGGEGYRFLDVDAVSGEPVRFNPCEPVSYVINPRGAPDGALAEVHEAFEMAADASGITFRFEGMTDEPVVEERPAYQPEVHGDRWAPILVGWVDVSAPQAEHHDVLGWATRTVVEHRLRQDVAVSGVVGLAADARVLRRGFGTGTYRGNVLLHEIGHLLGLDHVDREGEIMSPLVNTTTGDWGPGDRRGLALIGADAGCLHVPAPSRTRLERDP